jgi:gamma-glutamyltranspeptidase/glutathione hydrolase
MKKITLSQILTLSICLVPQAHLLAGTAALALPDPYAAAAVERVLLDDGNAVDAAITATFVQAVTFPRAGNIGGGGFMIAYMGGEASFLDFRENASQSAHRDMYLDEGGNVIANATLDGAKAPGVPGTVRGMQAAHARYGSLPWKRLLEPAIGLAREGYIVHPKQVSDLNDRLDELDGKTNLEQYFGHMKAGEVFRQPEMAVTLERIAEDPESFYSGLIARQIVAQMIKSGGILTLADLDAYKAVWRAPLQGQWRDYTVLTAPPPSSGGFALIQLLVMHDFAAEHFRDVWQNSAQYIHLLAEIEKRVFADRAMYLGDPDFVDVPLKQLLDNGYLAKRAKEINPKAISPPAEVPAGLESSETTHFSIVDKNGNAVALTYTLNWEFGSGVVVEGAGFALNNQMDDFSAKPGHKNKFGVIGNTFNSIEPGKRMLSSMSPTILLKDEKPAMVIGASGGSTIFTSIFQVILNVYDYAMPLQAAVDATRYHHQLPDAYLIRHDPREVPTDVTRELKALGYSVEENSWGTLGRVEAIRIDGDKVEAASDVRGFGDTRIIPAGP